MAGGKRYKFQGTTIQFITGFHAESPSGSISAVTKANPAVVTQTAHGKSSGAVIKVSSALGMTELNGNAYVIQVLTANTYSLLDTNSTDYGTYTGGGKVDTATFSQMCELTGYNEQGGSSPEIPATSICSTAQEFEVGLPDFGTVQADYNFAPQTTVQAAIRQIYKDGSAFASKVTLPNQGGIMVQLGFIQQTSSQSQVGGMWTGSLTMRSTGSRQDFAG